MAPVAGKMWFVSRFELTGLARIPLLVLQRAEELGLDRAELMRSAGLSAAELRDPDARVSMAKVWSVWRAAIHRSGDPAFGVRVGESTSGRHLGLVGYAMLYSSGLREALQHLERYVRIVSDAVRFEFHEDSAGAHLTFEPVPKLDALQHPVAARLAWVLTVSRKITAREIVPLEVSFPFSRPPETGAYRSCFRAPLRFDRPQGALLLPRADLDLPVITGDATLRGYLEQLAEEVLGSLTATSSFADRVRHLLWTELSAGQPTLERVASMLSSSVRTVQRRLNQEGTSFAGLLNEFRREMAAHLLRDPTLAVYEIAFLLGYSEPSTFFRAFRRWHGVSPQELRRRSIA